MNKPWFKNSETTNNTKFWGLALDNTLIWKMHIDLTIETEQDILYNENFGTYSDAGLPNCDLFCLFPFSTELQYFLPGKL